VQEAEQAAKLVCEDRESLEPIPKDPKKLQTDIENRAKAMAKQDRLRGMSVDEVKLLLKRTGDAHDKAKADVTRMVKLLNALKASMELRAHRWDNFRRYIALRAKANFLMFTSLRGYEGRLKFSHQKKRLDISVKTDEATQAARKDAKSLSGGEKSFSTVAFLLTLWESVNCPIRGLDEFDVFQDSVNRETSIRMLVETAMSTNEKQHILSG
jgi:chromosome segregation ATPase